MHLSANIFVVDYQYGGFASRDDSITELSVHMNSKNIILTYTELVRKWEVNDYINCKGYTVCNDDIIRAVQMYRKHLDNVEFYFGQFNYDTQYVSDAHHQDIYVAGSCRNNGQYGAYAGIGIHFPHREHLDICQPLRGKQTNNRSVLEAVRQALKVVGSVTQARQNYMLNVTIFSNSMYTVKTFAEWCLKWEENGYRTYDGKDVSNQDIIRDARHIIQNDFNSVNFVHTRAQYGHPGNTRADRYAQQGADENPHR